MTREQFRKQVAIVTVIYGIALLLGVGLRSIDISDGNIYYNTFKDLLSLIIALPAAYLGYCVQRRASFLQFLRAAWSNLVKAVNSAILYAQNEVPEKEEHTDVLTSLRVAIDELRDIYRNVGERPGQHGLYPVSPILDIYQEIEKLHDFRELTADEIERRRRITERIFDQWKDVRRVLLSELDRPFPSEAEVSRRHPDTRR